MKKDIKVNSDKILFKEKIEKDYNSNNYNKLKMVSSNLSSKLYELEYYFDEVNDFIRYGAIITAIIKIIHFVYICS